MTRGLRTIGLAVGILGMAAAVSTAEPSKAIREAIKNLQKSKNVEDRVEAARYLGGFDDPEAVQALAEALSDRDPEVQEAAASALWHTGEKAAAAKPALLKALDGSPPRVVARAAGALETMGVSPKDLADARRTVLKRRPDETTAFLAARGLIGLDPAAAILPPLLDYLDTTTRAAARPDHDSDDRDNQESAEKALLELAQTNDRSAIGPLRTALDGMPLAAPSLLPVLAAFKPPPDHFAQTLVKAMDSRSPEVRATAVRLCRGLTGEADVEVWGLPAANLTRDRDQTVRSWAVSALETAGARAAPGAPDLVRLLKSDPSVEIRRGAAKALEAMGDASQAVPQKTKVQVADAAKEALIAAAHDKDKDLAEAALNAYNVLYLPTAESVEALMRIAEASGPAPIRQRALTLLGRRQGQAKAVLERIRPLTQSADLATEAKEAFDWIQRGGPGSPNPLVGGSTAPRVASTTPAGAAAAPASTAGKPDPAAEARGLATLRRLNIEFDESQFYLVVSEANLEGVRAFLDAGMPANHRFANNVGRTPLLVLFFGSACTANEPTPEPARDVVKTLIAAGADVNLADDHKNTPLMWAAEKCDRATIRLLLVAGAKIDARNQSNMNALEGAVFSGNSGVEELIAAGARLDAQKAKDYLEAYKDDPKAVALIRKAAVK